MKNIWKVFRTDFKRISNNVVAVVIIMGLSIIPALYAWFNIMSNWNPYGTEATSGMKIGVFSQDEGFNFEKLSFNVGASVVENLQGNNTIDWQFPETYDDTLEGVYSGEYYAALIIPENFTEQLLSFIGGDIENPSILYYENSKKNAIATKITAKVRTTVQQSVNTTVIKSITEAATKTGGAVTGVSFIEELKNLEYEIGVFSSLLNSIVVIADSSSEMLANAQRIVPMVTGVIDSAENSLDGAKASVESMSKLAEESKEIIDSQIESVDQKLAEAQAKIEEYQKNIDVPQVDESIKTEAKEELDKQIESAKDYAQNAYEALKGVASENSGKYEDALNELQKYYNNISTNVDYELVKTQIAAYREALSAAQTIYNATAMPSLSGKLENVEIAIEMAKNVLGGLKKDVNQAGNNLEGYSESIDAGIQEIVAVRDHLNSLQSGLQVLIQTIEDMENDSQYNEVVSVLESDSTQVSSFVTSPVNIETKTFYEIETYGSAMAPFYTVLALWVGGLIMVALLHVKVKNCPEVEGTNNAQRFFGRYLMFFFVGQIQTLITVLGNLFFIQIQCLHPLKFWFAAAVMSFMFSFFMYALTAAWGNVGQAIAVVVMVIQVAGAGGTFPIEVLPKAFQAIYSFLPFTYAMNALRECVGGTYLLDYWKDLGVLGIYIIISIFLGLFAGKPFKKIMEMLEESKKKSGIML